MRPSVLGPWPVSASGWMRRTAARPSGVGSSVRAMPRAVTASNPARSTPRAASLQRLCEQIQQGRDPDRACRLQSHTARDLFGDPVHHRSDLHRASAASFPELLRLDTEFMTLLIDRFHVAPRRDFKIKSAPRDLLQGAPNP